MKGKTVITLTDAKTGDAEVFEDNNMITAMIEKVLNLGVTHQSMFPSTAYPLRPLWKTLAGGLYLFDDVIAETNLVVPNDANAVGYGAYNYVDSLGNPAMGNYNLAESEETESYIKMVWDFATDKCNGTIGSVCLGHPMGAKMGIGGVSNFNFSKKTYPFSKYLVDTSLSYSETDYGFLGSIGNIDVGPKVKYFENTGVMWTLEVNTTGVHVYAVDTRSRAIGMLDTTAKIVSQKDFLSLASYSYAGYDRSTKKAYFISSSTWSAGASATLAAIDLSNDDLSLATVATSTIVNRTGTSLNFSGTSNNSPLCSVVYNGYMYNGYNNISTLVKINLANDNDYAVITPTDNSIPYSTQNCLGLAEYNGLIFGCAGQAWVYNPKTGKMRGFFRNEYIASSRYDSRSQIGDDGVVGECVYTYSFDLHKFGVYHGALATINNLETPVTKTPDKTMKITYTLEITA